MAWREPSQAGRDRPGKGCEHPAWGKSSVPQEPSHALQVHLEIREPGPGLRKDRQRTAGRQRHSRRRAKIEGPGSVPLLAVGSHLSTAPRLPDGGDARSAGTGREGRLGHEHDKADNTPPFFHLRLEARRTGDGHPVRGGRRRARQQPRRRQNQSRKKPDHGSSNPTAGKATVNSFDGRKGRGGGTREVGASARADRILKKLARGPPGQTARAVPLHDNHPNKPWSQTRQTRGETQDGSVPTPWGRGLAGGCRYQSGCLNSRSSIPHKEAFFLAVRRRRAD